MQCAFGHSIARTRVKAMHADVLISVNLSVAARDTANAAIGDVSRQLAALRAQSGFRRRVQERVQARLHNEVVAATTARDRAEYVAGVSTQLLHKVVAKHSERCRLRTEAAERMLADLRCDVERLAAEVSVHAADLCTHCRSVNTMHALFVLIRCSCVYTIST